MEQNKLAGKAGSFVKAATVLAGLSVCASAHSVQPRLYQLGDGGAVAPHLALEFGSDNNVLRRNEGSDSSVYLRLQPSLRYVVQQRNNRLQLQYTGDYFQYAEDYCLEPKDANCPNGSPQFDKASFQDHTFAADGFLEVTRQVRVNTFFEQALENQPLGTGLSSNSGTLASLAEPDSFRQTLLRAVIAYGAPQARGEARGGISFTNKDFNDRQTTDGNITSFDNLSERSVTPSATLLYRVGVKTQVFAGLSQSDVTGGDSERTINRYFAGVEIDASAITSGSFQLTNVVENFDGFRTDLEYIGWQAQIDWKPRRFSTVSFSGGRESSRGLFNLDDPSLATFIGQDIGITTNIDIDWSHFWRDRISTDVSLSWYASEDVSDDGVAGVDANDVTTIFRLQGNYNLRRWLDVGAFFRTTVRDGDGVDRDYERTVFGLTANGTF